MPTFHPPPMRTWRPYLTGTPFRLAPMPTRYPCLPGAPFRPVPRFGWHPRPPDAMLAWHPWFHLVLIPARRSCMARCPCSSGARACLAPMFARRSCSPDVHVSPNVHAHLRLMLHPMLEGDRSDTYRARTSEINPPWQETCKMHDFGTPDAK